MMVSDLKSSSAEDMAAPSRRKWGGIFFRTFLLLFLLSLTIIIIFSVVAIPRQKGAIIKSLEFEARSVSASISQVCGNAIVNEDYEFIVEHSLEVIRNSPDILYIVIVSRNDFVLIHMAGRWEQKEKPDPEWSAGSNDARMGRITFSNLVGQKVFHYQYPLEYSGLLWGKMYMGLSLEYLNKEMRTMYRVMSMLGLLCLLVGILGAYFFARQLTRPVLSLLHSTRKITTGDLSARAEISTNDEIGALAVSFNEMTEKLEKTTVSRDYVTNIITNMNDIMIVVSQDGAIQMANRACGDLLGYTEDELLNKPISLIFKERKGFARGLKFDSLISRGAFRNVEKIAHSKTGEKIPILLSGAVMSDDENRVQGVICVALDMRERLESEAALKKSYEELQLTQSQLIQSAKLASIGELASGVAHELNQPLMVIRGIFQLVRRSIGKNNLGISELLEQLEPIERNTKRMMNIINHLRTFSRQSGMEFGPVDGNKIIEDSLLMIREQLRIHDIQVKKDPDVDLPKIKGDANQLEQVFLNLITNARDAILQRSEVSGKKSENRGRLEIITRMGETDNHQSSISGQQSQNFAEILIRDNGSGIPADKVGKIFDPFFTTKEVGKGTGLGLSISYGIIKDHQGEISVVETSPRGTTFRVRLPIVD